MRNVLHELPRDQHAQALNVMRAACKLTEAEQGVKKLEQLARFLEHDHQSAARSLREGLAEMFTVQRLEIPSSLYKCLGTTNVIESPQSGVQKRTNNVTHWRDASMVERWVASAWLLTEKHFRNVVGFRDFWAVSVILGREENPAASHEKVA
jgi:transposase-like protein